MDPHRCHSFAADGEFRDWRARIACLPRAGGECRHLRKQLRCDGIARVLAGFAVPYLLAILCCVTPRAGHAAGQELSVIRGDGVTVLFEIEIADTEAERAQGLMHRESLDARAGMLFDFGRETTIRMWMKNTLIPLDMLFLGENGHIRHIAANTAPYSEALIAAPGPARYVLELNAGEAAQFGIEVGDRLLLPAR
jgi:uncharacterized protein